MGNANTEHSKKLRAKTAIKSVQKRRTDPNHKVISIEGNAEIINQFISLLESTGQPTRIKQLSVLLEQYQKNS